MTSRSGQQTIAIHILPNISRSKDNQIIKLGQLIEYDWKNRAARLVPDHFCFLKKLYMT